MTRYRIELTIQAGLDHDNGSEVAARDDAAWNRLVEEVRDVIERPEFSDIEPWITS